MCEHIKIFCTRNLLQIFTIVLLLTFIGCSREKQEPTFFHPMVDGKNTEYQKLQVEPLKISEDINLYIFQNNSYVWICYDYPDGSFGTLDMTIETQKLKTSINLHVSAQLGEWPVGEEELIPKTPTSDLWWNMDGWIANTLLVNGIDTVTYNTPEFKIKNGEMRELQLSKERFGNGEWKIKFKINGIKGSDGQFSTIEYPNDDSYFTILVN